MGFLQTEFEVIVNLAIILLAYKTLLLNKDFSLRFLNKIPLFQSKK